MGTLVAPIGSAAVAMPAASRWSDRLAALVLEARLSMSWRESKGRRGQRRRGEGSSCGRLLLGRSDEFITADWVRTGPPNMSASSALPASPSPGQQSPRADWPARVSRLPSRLACPVRVDPDARAHGGDTHSPGSANRPSLAGKLSPNQRRESQLDPAKWCPLLVMAPPLLRIS